MQYQEFAPSENLQEIVQNYWCFHVYEDDGMQFPLKHETLPDSSVSNCINQATLLSRGSFAGPTHKEISTNHLSQLPVPGHQITTLAHISTSDV